MAHTVVEESGPWSLLWPPGASYQPSRQGHRGLKFLIRPQISGPCEVNEHFWSLSPAVLRTVVRILGEHMETSQGPRAPHRGCPVEKEPSRSSPGGADDRASP